MTTRRQFLVAGALGALNVRYAAAQGRRPRVGMLTGLPVDKSVVAPLLLNALAELGYRDGAGMILEYRHSAGDDREDRLLQLARELIAAKCDLIFALPSEPIARAFLNAQTQVPVVFAAVDYDPLEKRIVSSLRQPGGNLTGVYVPIGALTAKRLEIAQEVLPAARHFLVLTDTHTREQLAILRRAAESRQVQLTVIEYGQRPYDLQAGFDAGRRAGVEALIVFSSGEFASRRGELSALVAKYRLPLFASAFMAGEPGMLVGYSQDLPKVLRRAAEMGIKILKGGKPADMPVEQADTFELTVNLKTAAALGVKIPYSVLARATKVIE